MHEVSADNSDGLVGHAVGRVWHAPSSQRRQRQQMGVLSGGSGGCAATWFRRKTAVSERLQW